MAENLEEKDLEGQDLRLTREEIVDELIDYEAFDEYSLGNEPGRFADNSITHEHIGFWPTY